MDHALVPARLEPQLLVQAPMQVQVEVVVVAVEAPVEALVQTQELVCTQAAEWPDCQDASRKTVEPKPAQWKDWQLVRSVVSLAEHS
jgi:hypothetical protein